MIDVDQMVAFLSGDPYLITPGETLTPQIQRLIAPYSPSVSMRMFRGGKGEDGRHLEWKVEIECQICGKSGVLNVHHRNYEHHGTEVYHTEDLICLCDECHNLYHGK